MNHSPTPWVLGCQEFTIEDGQNYAVATMAGAYVDQQSLAQANAERIVACVNACASIPTESLTTLNWQLAPVGGARPVDVAALLLRLGTYREAAEKLVEQAQRCNFEDENGHLLSMNTAYRAIEEALK